MKFFIWEIVHKAISTNENLHKRMPYMTLYPSWCPLCNYEVTYLCNTHTLIISWKRMPYMTLYPSWCPLCNYEVTYLCNTHTLIISWKGFSLFLDDISLFPSEVKNLLKMTLTYHLFKNSKVFLWKNLIMAFFGINGKKKIEEYSQRTCLV